MARGSDNYGMTSYESDIISNISKGMALNKGDETIP